MANLQFWRLNQMSDTSFLDLVKRTFGKTFTKGIDAKDWLITNGYYTSYPDIVTDGLVLNLDAANSDSFKGEPTINLHSVYSSGISTTLVGTSPISAACGSGGWSWCAYGGSYTFNYKKTRNPYGLVSDVGNLQNTVTGGDYRMEIADIGATTLNRTFTFSVWMKNNGGSVTSVQITLATNGDSNGAGQVFSITNEWQRLVYTRTFTGTCTNNVRTYFFGLEAGTNVLLYGAQLEEKDHVSPFIDGTRGTTFATGGGWCDLSGNGNHGELGNTPLYDSSNLGSVVFGGIDDWIQMTSVTGTYSKISFDFWGYVDDTNPYVRNESAFGDWTDARIHFGTRWSVGMHWNVNNGWVEIPTTYLVNGWNHYCLTWNNVTTQKKVYINNNLSSTESTNGNVILGDFKIGVATNLGAYYRGKMGNFKIYNKDLSTTEITQNFNAYKERFGL